MFEMWDLQDVRFSGCGMFLMRDVWDVDVRNLGSSGCEMFGMWDSRDVECSGCGMWDVFRDV